MVEKVMSFSALAEATRFEGDGLETISNVRCGRDLEIKPLWPGKIQWIVDTIRMGKVRLYRACFSRGVLLIGTVPPGFVTIICSRSASSNIHHYGERVSSDCLGFELPGSAILTIVPDANEIVVLQLPASVPGCVQAATRQPGHHLAIEASGGSAFIGLLDGVIDQALTQTNLLFDKGWCRACEREVGDNLVALLEHGSLTPAASSQYTRSNALFRALMVIHRQREPMPLHELADVAGTTPRTLQRIFCETIGSTPLRYLRWNRILGLRRELLEASPHSSTVTAIATRWGFTEMGRLAAEYRQLFGELPRVTLLRKQVQSTGYCYGLPETA